MDSMLRLHEQPKSRRLNVSHREGENEFGQDESYQHLKFNHSQVLSKTHSWTYPKGHVHVWQLTSTYGSIGKSFWVEFGYLGIGMGGFGVAETVMVGSRGGGICSGGGYLGFGLGRRMFEKKTTSKTKKKKRKTKWKRNRRVNPDVIGTLEEDGLKFVGKDESGK
ncbi:hypothetical protein JHK82_031853 [Glycine max]|nr:hypothetical protein JHK82_031853 [Glycine max]